MLNNNIGIIENNHLIRTWGVQTDITERKKTERELIETNKELDTFFYKASHDLKGPLASIMGIVNLARLEQDTNATQNFFDMIESSTIRLDNTLVDLIELARSRKGVSKLSEVNVSQLVNNILSSLSHIKGYEQSEIKVNIDPQLNLITDKVLLTSILQNLIHNAINYCKRIDPLIKVQAKQENKNVIFEVIDNGPGIALHIRDKVFEMFYRGNPDSPGSGLGLFIVKNAVEKLQGKISYDTQEGKGTNFIVSLPLQLNLD
jgi:signal transduction histidine kinase